MGGIILGYYQVYGIEVFPNTAGSHSAKEAITTAQMAREVFGTNWVKLEVIGDQYNLQPDPFETVKAAEILIKEGFEVFPYTTDDLVVAKRLADVGCKIIMPWGSTIGSGKGLMNPDNLIAIRKQFPDLQLVVDAGIGKPSHLHKPWSWDMMVCSELCHSFGTRPCENGRCV